MRCFIPLLLLCGMLAAPATAALNPAEFQRHAPDQVRVRETARIVQDITSDGSTLRRVTLVGEVIDQKNREASRIGQVIVIDFSIDLGARDRAGSAHRQREGNRPGAQSMHQPDPPTLDDEGAFWANLAAMGSDQARSTAHAGAVPVDDQVAYRGAVFVPVSGQYSFDEPGD